MKLEDNYSPWEDLKSVFEPLINDPNFKISSEDKLREAHYWLTYKQFDPHSVNSQFQSLRIGSKNSRIQEDIA